jgi:IS605 OrfB family transposase
VAWSTQTFRQLPIHRLTYGAVRETFGLAAQLAVRCIGKVADAYKLDRETQRTFEPHGAVPYDDRILSYTHQDTAVSIWTLDGRQEITIVCGERGRQLLASRRGETDLVFVGGSWYLFATWVNHNLSKRIVAKAECTKRAIAMEDLTHIRTRIKARRSQRATLHSWAFGQLRGFISYKAQLSGVPVHFVDPRNTSRTCPVCGHCAKSNRKTQASFVCTSCGFAGPADVIAAGNISRRAPVSAPHVSEAAGPSRQGQAQVL